jgi:dolichol-phosphate mannosyltransferase
MKKSLTVICPVYNEEAVIRDFYNELREVLVRLKDKYESKSLFVVDPGTDSTLEILKQIARTDSSVQIIALSSQFGHQMSLLAGMDNSHSDCTIMMDSDLQHPPSLIPEMLDLFEKGFDVVYTVRRDVPESNIFKHVSSKAFYRMINLISQVPINESAADFRLISRRVLTVFKHQIRERNQFLRGLIKWVGFKSIGIPFQSKKRPAGKSKYSLGRMVQFGIHGILSFSKRPLQAATFVGFIFALFGFIYGLIVFIQYFFDKSLPSGWTTLIILISMFSGVQLIFLGIIGEYIGAIFDEVKGRPHYIIDEKINFNNLD